MNDERNPVEHLKSCGHAQCVLCWRRECQRVRIKKYATYSACDDCVVAAVSIAYAAACRLGIPQERPCGVTQSVRRSADSDPKTDSYAETDKPMSGR